MDSVFCSAAGCRKTATIVMDCQHIEQVSTLEWNKCQAEFRSCDSHDNQVADLMLLHQLEFHPHNIHHKAPTLFEEILDGTDPYETKKLIAKDPDKWRKLSNYITEMRRIRHG